MNDPLIPIITVDGPSGVGKGTISLSIANKLQWNFLDSGAIYRTLAYYAVTKAVDLQDEEALIELAIKLPIGFVKTGNNTFNFQVYLNDRDVTAEIRTENCSKITSKIAKFPKVRNVLLAIQRSFMQSPGLVADGRDMGTVVFPDAKLKFFLEASVEERARRRYLQLKEGGLDVNLATIMEEMTLRDQQDRERIISPMVPAVDAIIIDTTNIDIEKVFFEIMKHIKQRFNFA